MIGQDLRDRLIALIERIPGTDSALGRTTLLTDIPHDVLARDESNKHTDVKLLVIQLETSFGPAGEWWLLQMVRTAAANVRGTELETLLMSARDELARITPVAANPAATAQVHMFDLRKIVFKCITLLPNPPGLSGFVITGATPRLVRYFSESLRYRGAESGEWTRDRIVATAPPLVVGPLQVPVVAAIDRARRVQGTLTMKHVVWAAYVESASDAAVLWQGIRSLAGSIPHHLIVVFGLPASSVAPDGMEPLPSPAFTSEEISTWIKEIVKARKWELSVVQRSTAFVVSGYQEQGPFPVDDVYDRLLQYHDLVNEHRDDRALLQALNDLDGMGG
jgi:hypothetical protein